MTHFTPIESVLVVGGTHGNELSGVQAVTNWQLSTPKHFKDNESPLDVNFHLANKPAIEARCRFVDDDLNRQFTLDALQSKYKETNASSSERNIAYEFNKTFGPKHSPKTDFIIDIHNTTSNMGPTLIILVNDEFHRQLARFVKLKMPESIILIEDYQDYDKFAYLCTVGKRGVMVEIGPQAHSTLREDIYNQAVKMTETIIHFIHDYNKRNLPNLTPVEAFRLIEEVSYPTYQCTSSNEIRKKAMIHSTLQDQDFKLLQHGAPCFVDFAGNDIYWNGEDTYPHFIGEAAYDHLNLAFATANKCLF